MYYLGFYSHDGADIYYDILSRHLDFKPPVSEYLEEIQLGSYRMYLNHGDTNVNLRGFDLLKDCAFTEVEPYGVVLVKNE